MTTTPQLRDRVLHALGVLGGETRKFDPKQLRDPRTGKWIDNPASAVNAIVDGPPTFLVPGARVYHRTRHEHGIYLGPDEKDPSGATSWVDFGDDEVLMVSTHLLEAPRDGAPGRSTPSPDVRLAGKDVTPGGEQLHHYWTKDKEGLAKWAGSPHPFTALYRHLVKHVGPERAKRMAAKWHKEVFGIWPGEKAGKNPAGPG